VLTVGEHRYHSLFLVGSVLSLEEHKGSCPVFGGVRALP
jgi:hypothetical protein